METVVLLPTVRDGRLKFDLKEGSTKKVNRFDEIEGSFKLIRDLNIKAVIIKKSQEFDKSALGKVFK